MLLWMLAGKLSVSEPTGDHPMDRIEIEKIGGFAGFGGPGSKLKSKGEVFLSSLSSTDRSRVEKLFAAPKSPLSHPDAFRYRLSRQTSSGLQSVEVPEEHVPESVRSSVVDTLE